MWKCLKEMWKRLWSDEKPFADSAVRFDAQVIRFYARRQHRWFRVSEEEVWSLRWDEIDRIGYVTAEADAWFDDYFLVFWRGRDNMYFHVPFGSCDGVLELAEHVKSMPGTKLTEKGTLANSVHEDSVTIWPEEHAGESMDMNKPTDSSATTGKS